MSGQVRLVVSMADAEGDVRTERRALSVDELRDDFKPADAIARDAMHQLVDDLFDQAREVRIVAERLGLEAGA